MPEMTAPAGNVKPEIGMVTVIPDELKKLARLVVRGFYNKYTIFAQKNTAIEKKIFLLNSLIRDMIFSNASLQYLPVIIDFFLRRW